jgi:hypothetical protein
MQYRGSLATLAVLLLSEDLSPSGSGVRRNCAVGQQLLEAIAKRHQRRNLRIVSVYSSRLISPAR